MAENTKRTRAGVWAALLGGTALVAPLALFAIAPPALAACNQTGNNVSCTETTFGYNAGTQANLNVTVQPGANVNGDSATDAIRITSTTTATLTNNGTIDGFVTILSGNPGSDTFTNNGVLKITDPNTNIQEHSMTGTNFIQTANGIFLARVDANGFYDGILSRTANLNGRLVIVVTPGIYTTVNNFTSLINTTTGLTGNFSSVASSSPFFSVTTAIAGNDLDVTLIRIAFNAVSGLTPNQQAVANVLEPGYSTTLDTTSTRGRFYSNLLAATSLSALDQLSGQGITASQGTSFGAGSLFTSAMSNQSLSGDGNANSVIFNPAPLQFAPAGDRKPRGSEAFASLVTKAPPVAEQPGRWRVWTAGFGADRRIDSEASPGSASQTSRTYGGTIGVDQQVTRDLRIGISAGGSESNFAVSDLATSGRVTGGHVGVYAVKTWNAFYAATSLSYARFENSTTRTITGIGTTETATGSFASDLLGGRVEFGWKQAYRGFFVTPFVAIEPSTLRQRGFTETSVQSNGTPGILGLTFDSRTTHSLPTFVGAQFDTRYTLANGWALSPFARLSWVHKFQPNRQISASFVTLPTAAFTVDGARAASDSARLDTGAKLTVLPGKTLFANLTGEWSDRGRSYAAAGGFRAAW